MEFFVAAFTLAALLISSFFLGAGWATHRCTSRLKQALSQIEPFRGCD